MVKSGGKELLIDGFPRAIDQAARFEEMIKPCELVLFFDCHEDVMEARLLKRGETSGRSDDNADTIRKRFKTFVEQSLLVIDHYEAIGKAVKIDAARSPDKVFECVQKAMQRLQVRDGGRAGCVATRRGRLKAAGRARQLQHPWGLRWLFRASLAVYTGWPAWF